MFTGILSNGLSIGETVFSVHSEFNNEGVRYLTGNLSGYENTTSRLVTAAIFDDNGVTKIGILVDSSTSYYRFYTINLDENKATGRYWLYRKEESPSGAGTAVMGVKMFDKYEINATTNQATKNIEFNNLRDAIDKQIYQTMIDKQSVEIPTSLYEVIEDLQGLQNSMALN